MAKKKTTKKTTKKTPTKKTTRKKSSTKKATSKKAAAKKAAAKKPASKKASSSSKRKRASVKAHPDAELTVAQATELYERLLDERLRVTQGMGERLSDAISDSDQLADEIDIARRHTEQAYLMRFADKERKLLKEIAHAIEKFEHGEYGLCEGTDEPIGFNRLSLRPWTRYSVGYKEQLEIERRQRGR